MSDETGEAAGSDDGDRDPTVFKILRPEEHAVLEQHGRFAGSPDDERDGFIHLSTREQLGDTLAKHFAGEEDLVILALDAEAMGDALRWEPSRGGALFPHLYGAILEPMVRGRVAIPDAGDEQGEPPGLA